MNNRYRKIAMILVLSLILGLIPDLSGYSATTISFSILIGKKTYTKKTYKITKGKSKTIGLNMKNTAGTFATRFKSSKTSVGTVNQNGKVKAKKVGTTKITVTVTGKKSGKKVTKSSWVKFKVVKASAATATPTPTPGVSEPMRAILLVNSASGSTSTEVKKFNMSILDNDSGRMLYDSLPKTITMYDVDGCAKMAADPSMIYKMDEYKPSELAVGDFMLYGQNRYYLFYQKADLGYAYTRLGKVTNPSELASALGTGQVSVTIIKDILPSAVPTPSALVSPTVRSTASVSPGASTSPSASVSPTAMGSVNPSASTTATASAGASASPTATSSASVAPTATPSATPNPYSYSGPKIQVTVVDTGQRFYLNVDSNNATALRFYNSLPRQMVMTPFNDRRYVNDAYLSDTIENTDAIGQTRWGAGTLALLDTNRVFLFIKSEQTSDSLNMAILGEYNKELSESTSFLTTAFPNINVVVVFDKA